MTSLGEKILQIGIVVGIATIMLTGIFLVLAGIEMHFAPSPLTAREIFLHDKSKDIFRKEISVLFVGDVMLGRHVEELSKKEGPAYPFRYVQTTFRSADAVVSNLEGPIVEAHEPTPSMSYAFSFPKEVVSVLKGQNIKIVSLGNNHTLDRGSQGLLDTQRFLREAGILFAGEPYSVGEVSLATTTIEGQRFAFVMLNATNPRFDREAAVKVVGEASEKYGGAYSIVYVHWGNEYEPLSSTSQQKLARAFVDAGADLVIGHHPHVVQEIEQYKNSYIFYSLGNFIFDQYFSKAVQEGLALKMVLGKNSRIELLPYTSVRSQPRFLEGEEKALWLENFSAKGAPEIKGFIEEGFLPFVQLTN